MTTRAPLLAALLAACAPAFAADAAAPESLDRVRAAADRGEAAAQVRLGWIYENGSGAPQDFAEAVRWYRKAAEQGDAEAENSLGWMYQNGRGVARDPAAALQWYEKSAAQADAAGEVDLGWLYENGVGVARDYDKAVALYRRAASAGSGDGQNALGWMYQNGYGVAKSDAEAADWYRKAAAQGNERARANLGVLESLVKAQTAFEAKQYEAAAAAWRQAAETGSAEAQYRLGILYELGLGVPRNLGTAANWYGASADQGRADAQAAAERLRAAAARPAPPPDAAAPPPQAASVAVAPPAPAAPSGSEGLAWNRFIPTALLLLTGLYYFGWWSAAGLGLLVKALAYAAPEHARPIYQRFRVLGGKLSALSGAELYAIYRGSGALVELTEEAGLSPAQAVAVARALSEDRDDFHALRLLSGARTASAALSDDELETVIRVYERAGRLGDLVNKVWYGKPEEFLGAAAAVFRRLGMPTECIRVLKLKKSLAPEEERMLAEAQAALTPASAAAVPAAIGASAPAAASDEGLVAGRYEMQRKIGEGGMGLVFEAYDRKLSRRVAIKKMRPEIRMNPVEHQRFVAEARILSHLTHPCIVGVHDVVESPGDTFLIMDFVDGRPLSAILHERGRLPLKECTAIFEQVCAGVHHAHENRVLHRDLKPANILVGKDGYARVADFGVARHAKETFSLITHLEFAGTLAYMAPEQHMGRSVRATDVFALGVSLYEMLTGVLPFTGPDFLAQKERKLYPAPQFLAPELPPSIEPFMAAALEPVSKLRIADAAEFLARLKNV